MLLRKSEFIEQSLPGILLPTCTKISDVNTLWTGDADLRLYITTVQDG